MPRSIHVYFDAQRPVGYEMVLVPERSMVDLDSMPFSFGARILQAIHRSCVSLRILRCKISTSLNTVHNILAKRKIFAEVV
jgi:hypothetical protein